MNNRDKFYSAQNQRSGTNDPNTNGETKWMMK